MEEFRFSFVSSFSPFRLSQISPSWKITRLEYVRVCAYGVKDVRTNVSCAYEREKGEKRSVEKRVCLRVSERDGGQWRLGTRLSRLSHLVYGGPYKRGCYPERIQKDIVGGLNGSELINGLHRLSRTSRWCFYLLIDSSFLFCLVFFVLFWVSCCCLF